MINGSSICQIIENTLDFQYSVGANTPTRRPHTTGWRNLPFIVVAHLDGGSFLVEFNDSKPIVVNDGETLLLAPGRIHRAGMMTDGELQCRWAHIFYSILGSLNLFNFFEIPNIIKGTASNSIRDILDKLNELYSYTEGKFTLQNIVKRREVTFSMLSILLEQSGKDLDVADFHQDMHRLLPVIEYINKNIGSSTSRETLAEVASLSPTRFHYVFKECFGMAPMTYVKNTRMRKAQQLLLSSDLSISEVAERFGFADPYYFTRIFKESFGITPTQFRKSTNKAWL